jgi:hypothetical protein
MDNKFISRDALQKRKARENETSSQRETRLVKQRENTQQKEQGKMQILKSERHMLHVTKNESA